MSRERPDPQSYHTRLGWWVMTHERGGPVVIGSAAAVVLAGDLVFAGVRWDREFGMWFAMGMAVLMLAPLLGRAFGNGIFAGNVLVFVVVGAVVWIPPLTGGSYAGALSGMVAGLSVYFAALSSWWLRVRRA